MRIFNFLKKITNTKKVNEVVIEKLNFSEIEDWIENKIKENKLKEKEIIFLVNEKIKDFIKELKEKIIILEEFDVGAKKGQERIKNIVINSREIYIESVGDLIGRLNNLEESKLEKFAEKINKIFFDFNKSSFKNYERTTILIGKEMASIKESLKIFSKDLLRIFEENKHIIDSFDNFLKIKEKLDVINSINKTLKEICEKKLDLNKKINRYGEENKILKQNLEEIKTSSDYLENLAKQKKIEFLKEELRNNIFGLKQLLDFKALGSFFHINPKQMKMVKDCRENFQTNFRKDNGKMIIDLLDEAKLNNNAILEKINLIKTKIKEISDYEKDIKDDKTQRLYTQIKGIIIEIDNLKIEGIKGKKRGEKLRVNKKELVDVLSLELEKMGVEII